MKRNLQTTDFAFTYSENHVDSHVLWDNHCHAQYEMIAVLDGDINVMLEGINYRLTENQFIIVPPLYYHTVTANKSGDYKRITVFFDIDAVPSVIRHEYLHHSKSYIHYSSLLKEMQVCFLEDDISRYEPLISSLIVPLLYEQIKVTATIHTRDKEADDLILKIIEYIDSHLCGKILLEDLAKHTAYSKTFICHHFEEIMNIAPGQYILQKKMALAQKMIKEGSSSILVASQLGYKNYGSFYRIYTKHFGKKPSDTK